MQDSACCSTLRHIRTSKLQTESNCLAQFFLSSHSVNCTKTHTQKEQFLGLDFDNRAVLVQE